MNSILFYDSYSETYTQSNKQTQTHSSKNVLGFHYKYSQIFRQYASKETNNDKRKSEAEMLLNGVRAGNRK